MTISTRIGVMAASVALASLALTSCSGGGQPGGDDATDDNKPEKLTVAAWMDFPPDLLAAFEEEYGIKVVVNSFPDGASAQTVLRNGLSSDGAGLSDVHLIELDWWAEMMAVPEAGGASRDPRPLGRLEGHPGLRRRLGHGIRHRHRPPRHRVQPGHGGGSGLATDPDTFGEFIGGEAATWESFLDAGRDYVATSDNYFIDSLSSAFQAAINLLPSAFEDPESAFPTTWPATRRSATCS